MERDDASAPRPPSGGGAASGPGLAGLASAPRTMGPCSEGQARDTWNVRFYVSMCHHYLLPEVFLLFFMCVHETQVEFCCCWRIHDKTEAVWSPNFGQFLLWTLWSEQLVNACDLLASLYGGFGDVFGIVCNEETMCPRLLIHCNPSGCSSCILHNTIERAGVGAAPKSTIKYQTNDIATRLTLVAVAVAVYCVHPSSGCSLCSLLFEYTVNCDDALHSEL